MVDATDATANLLLAYSAYAVGTASPGPSNLSIMSSAVTAGRRTALLFAAGVVSGSVFWGLVAALGLATVLTAYSDALVVMKALGGLYLLWLAVASASSAASRRCGPATLSAAPIESPARTYFRGAAMHLTNPKAIFVWLSIVALALPAGAQRTDALLVVAGCTLIGAAVFSGYAVLFSTTWARRVYLRTRVWFDGALALLFGYAGIRMLTSR